MLIARMTWMLGRRSSAAKTANWPAMVSRRRPGLLDYAVDRVAPQQEPGDAGGEDQAGIDQQDLPPVPVEQRHQDAVGQHQREYVPEERAP